MVAVLRAALLCAAAFAAQAQTLYTYIGQITSTSVLLAWGNTTGNRGANTIGRDAASPGETRIRFGDRSLTSDKAWIEIGDLRPDTPYAYEVTVNGKSAGAGTVRTYPAAATRVTFFVIGDYGTGSSGQRAIAAAMQQEFDRRAQSADPPRFVLTVGDNIYANLNLGYLVSRSGDQDRDWEPKFFAPYKNLLRNIPFYPTLGNHDGNATENRADLTTYLDNFFFPGNRPARWYRFSYGGLADFFALDSTENTTGGSTAPAFNPEGEQSRWLAQALSESRAPWKIPYFHHPPFNAGPGHGASYSVLRHWVDMFQKDGVKVVFTGHEHNFQYSEDSDATGHVRYVLTGAGGELRSGNVTGNMALAHIEGFAAQRHFLVVEIEGRVMRITPVSSGKMSVQGRDRKEIPLPLVIRLPE
jgi:tartrate-resistant acid phosphatase type 5